MYKQYTKRPQGLKPLLWVWYFLLEQISSLTISSQCYNIKNPDNKRKTRNHRRQPLYTTLKSLICLIYVRVTWNYLLQAKEFREYAEKKHQSVPSDIEQIVSKQVTELPEHTVTITDISEIDLAGHAGTRLGLNKVRDYMQLNYAKLENSVVR